MPKLEIESGNGVTRSEVTGSEWRSGSVVGPLAKLIS